MKLGFGKALYATVREARQREWDNVPSRHSYAQAIQLHSARIISCDPTDTDAILRNTQAMKAFLTNMENKVQSGETQ